MATTLRNGDKLCAAVGRSPPLSGGAGAAAEHAFVQPPPPPLACSRPSPGSNPPPPPTPPLPLVQWRQAWSNRRKRFYWWNTVTMERVWNLPRLHKAAASEHSATATSTLARQSQAGCTGGAPEDAIPRIASSRVENDGAGAAAEHAFVQGVPLLYTSLGRDQIRLLCLWRIWRLLVVKEPPLLCLWRIWRLLVVREPPSDSEYTPRQINGVVVKTPLELWDDGCRIYMTAVPNVFRAWRTEAAWRADWREVRDLHVWTAVRNVFWAWRTEAEWRADWREVRDLHVWMALRNVFRAWRTEAAWHGGGQIDSQPLASARILVLSHCYRAWAQAGQDRH